MPDPDSGANDVWIWDDRRGLRSRFTFDAANDQGGAYRIEYVAAQQQVISAQGLQFAGLAGMPAAVVVEK